MNFTVNGDWQKNRLTLSASANAKDAKLMMNAALPASLSLAPFATDLSAATKLSGKIAADMQLALLNGNLRAGGNRAGGHLFGDAVLSGALGSPKALGRFNLEDGSFDNSSSGICLRNVSAVIAGSNDAVTLEKLHAPDHEGGALDGRAALQLTGDKKLSGAIHFNQFGLFCGGPATGNIAGQLNAGGTMQNALLAGKLTLGPIRAQIPGAKNDTGIPEVAYEWAGRSQAKPVAANLLRLDIAIDAPHSIFVRGRGLDAEFGGNLNVTGDAAAPVIDGQFSSRRGRFDLLDRTLKLDNATIKFQGSIPPSPYLDIATVTDVDGTTINLNLKGPAMKPDLTLTSTPAKPKDEVLALLLFRRDLQSITPFQAIKLAQAARVLAGLDSGAPGIMDKLRGQLGLDTLDVGTDDNNNVTIGAGKYITDKIYVDVRQGNSTDPQDKEVNTEIELTPDISANTSVDGIGNRSVGAEWKYDY